MSKRAIPALASDFSEVVSFLQQRGIISASPPTATIGTAKQIHADTYSLILWRFRLRRLPDRAKVFLDEIASDALQILPQIMMGYGKTAKLLVRGIVENTLRHIYFADHPIEYLRMNRDIKWYLSWDELCEYAKRHPEIEKSQKHFDALGNLGSVYSDLSAGIHGRSIRDLETRTALRKIVYDNVEGKKEAALLSRATASVNFLIAIFHRPSMRDFGPEDRRIILRTMPDVARRTWTDHE